MQQKQQNGKITTYLSIIILNDNGLSSPIKRHRLADLKKQNRGASWFRGIEAFAI
jgi:hypothetical protein